MSTTQSGFLLIADITGYTRFLNASELEHAQDILSTLLELLIQHTRPPLVISRLAGDAVISYGLQGNFFQGQTFVELIEDTYVAFRRAINLMVLNNTCRCNACANVSSLDLKFFVHYGQFAVQRLSAQDELVGNDVNLLHRLLKNQVAQRTGWRGYALYTAAAIHALGLEAISEAMTPHSEQVEHLGEVQVWVQNMQPIWTAKETATVITIPPGQIAFEVAADIDLPPPVVWDYLADPEHRRVVIGSDRQILMHRHEGRTAPGSVFQCFHGDQIVVQTVLEWRPFERMVTQDLIPIPIRGTTVLLEFRLEPAGDGTRLVQIFSKARGSLAGRLMGNIGLATMKKGAQRDIDHFKVHVETLQTQRGELNGGSGTGATEEEE